MPPKVNTDKNPPNDKLSAGRPPDNKPSDNKPPDKKPPTGKPTDTKSQDKITPGKASHDKPPVGKPLDNKSSARKPSDKAGKPLAGKLPPSSQKNLKKSIAEDNFSPGTDAKYGWFLVFNSFICNMIVDGVQYTFANFLIPISISFNTSVTSVSIVGSLLSGFYNFSGPIASALGNKFGFRMVIITGTIISAGGFMLSSLAHENVFLCFFYGVLGGLGFGMIYMSTVIMTSLYFDKYRALAVSLSVCGTGVGTFVFAPVGTFLVRELGWRHALLAEGGIILVCILSGISFKPLEIIRVVPTSRRPSDLSLISGFSGSYIQRGSYVQRGSIFYSPENYKPLRNDEYPTFKKALNLPGEDDEDYISEPPSEVNIGLQNVLTSVKSPQSNSKGKKEKPEHKCKRSCRICCFNFWHCQCKKKDLTLGDRPMYRDDIFYGGSISSLTTYQGPERINYHLSVTRIPDAQDIEQHEDQKCCVCHRAILRTCTTMTGIHLLKSKVFVFLCLSSFFYTMSLFIPYVFIRKVAKDNQVPDDIGLWLVSVIGISNTAGRLVSGLIKSFSPKVNASVLCLFCLMVSGVFSFVFIPAIHLASLLLFSCIFGFFTAPFISLRPVIIVEFLGLEKLTNAFGLVLLSQGVASIIGPPAAGALEEKTGHSIFSIYLSGALMIASALSLMISVIIHKRKR